jgi:methylmalonyl-CoA decarboxylase
MRSTIENSIGTIIFNNAKKHNCLNRKTLDEFLTIMEKFRKEKVRVVVLRAEKGAKVWSAGLDINELPEPGIDPLDYDHPFEQALREVQHFPVPVIAMIEGSVWGGACDLAFVCDLLICTPSATFAITPAKIGVPYNPSGILHFLNVVGMNLAKEMFFTACPISAERAFSAGIVNHLVSADEIEEFTHEKAALITKNSPLSIAVIKEQLRILGKSYPITPETFERIQELRTLVYNSDDYIEGKKAFQEKRKPVFKGK